MATFPPSYHESQATVPASATHPALRHQPDAAPAPLAPRYTQREELRGHYAPVQEPQSRTSDELPGYTPAHQTSTRYGRYASEADYLNALRAWAHKKQFYQPGELSADGSDNTLVGFYGKTTLEDYASRPGLQLRRGKKSRDTRDMRRATIAAGALHTDEDGDDGTMADEGAGEALSRRATVDHATAAGASRGQADSSRRPSLFGGLLSRKRSS